jgi:hypothetical protein
MPIVSLLELSEAWPCFLPERRYLVQQDKKKHTIRKLNCKKVLAVRSRRLVRFLILLKSPTFLGMLIWQRIIVTRKHHHVTQNVCGLAEPTSVELVMQLECNPT